MEDYAQLLQRLLEIQSGERKRSPELSLEDKRLMDRLQRRTQTAEPAETVKPSPGNPARARFKA
jgi:hypothetical protein